MEHTAPQAATVLVVDDEPITMEIVSEMLKDAGFRVVCAGNGQECLEIVDQGRVDLVLMDVNMPGMDGLEACRLLNQAHGAVKAPVVFITGSVDDKTLEAAFEVGGEDYVRKPIGRVELLTRINRVLERQRTLDKLAEDEKLKGVLETAAGVCHKLNQPLQFVMGTVQIMLMEAKPGDPLYAGLETLNRKIEQMGDITRKLADITRRCTTDHAGQEILDIDGSSD